METNAILAISSLDRYTTNADPFRQFQRTPATTNYSLIGAYNNSLPHSDDFQITTPGVLTYGYISKIIVSQIQLQYNIPTVNSNLNDTLPIAVYSQSDPTQELIELVYIPTGFYTPNELASITAKMINENPTLAPLNFNVIYNQELNQFEFTTQSGTKDFWFPDYQDILRILKPNSYEGFVDNVLKTYKLFGIALLNSYPNTQQYSAVAPSFLYTPFIEIYSNALTAYQKLSDGNSTVGRPKGLVARILLSGQAAPQTTTGSVTLGDAPFVLTADLSSPKVIRWTKDVAINSIDFQLRDCYGDLIPGHSAGFNTEFQMTLLCIEGDQD